MVGDFIEHFYLIFCLIISKVCVFFSSIGKLSLYKRKMMCGVLMVEKLPVHSLLHFITRSPKNVKQCFHWFLLSEDGGYLTRSHEHITTDNINHTYIDTTCNFLYSGVPHLKSDVEETCC